MPDTTKRGLLIFFPLLTVPWGGYDMWSHHFLAAVVTWACGLYVARVAREHSNDNESPK